MNQLQRAIEHLLLAAGASRAMLQLRRDGGDFAIAAEAVQHDQSQIRQYGSQAAGGTFPDPRRLESGLPIIVESGVGAQMLAPLEREGRLIGAISLQHRPGAREWSARDQDALRDTQAKVLGLLDTDGHPAADELRSAAIQAVLDRVRLVLDAQRCTFRQPVQEAFAFPVTFESRDAQVRSLLGDFTIVQTGQPVIVKLLAERAQVIQEDCASASRDPLFHKMLGHYGGMRAQMVTPYIVGDELKGVLSVHELRHTRVWTPDEKRWAAEAAALVGAITTLP
ncbi:MAG TPA: GAF domain-containing protein [Xanthobacteraceae bacterium]|nr:GAF domain-containing protein [Xanthobacteraceae bacterium]